MRGSPDLLLLEETLEGMLIGNVDITARGATRQPNSPFKHPSDITRNSERRRLLGEYKAKQAQLRALMARADKQSKSALSLQITKLKHEKAILESERELLIASHKAVLLAVGEIGGMAAWRRFFAAWQETLEDLRRIGAVTPADVETLPLTNSGQPPGEA